MPKGAHPPRSNASKKPASSAPKAEDDSFIVFGDGKDKPRKRGKPANIISSGNAGSGKSKAAEKDGEASADAPKKPDTRVLIGGASWTGKLPVNMLSEHCQKQKWERPDYVTRNAGKGFEAHVILRSRNPKTGETTQLPSFHVPVEHKELAVQPTALEARHFAATYTLFRVANMKNIHMMMPPTYRDLWKGAFADIKKQEEAQGKGWHFGADPFAAAERRESEKVAGEKKRADAQKERERREKDMQPGIVVPGTGGASSANSIGRAKFKPWIKAPKVDLGKRMRQDVERLVRRGTTWNPHGVTLDASTAAAIIKDVTAMGFRASHVEEATNICKDREEVIEWLLIHVPEDDLPRWALPDNYTAGVSMASGDLKREAILKRLASAGYAAELCAEMLVAAKGQERLAAALLQARLLSGGSGSASVTHDISQLPLDGEDGAVEAWTEEAAALQAIYAERYHGGTDSSFAVTIQSPGHQGLLKAHFTMPPGHYPNVLPLLSIEAALPSYIRLAITKQALSHATSEFLGEAMGFSIVDWLEHNCKAITDHPGPLRDISAAGSVVSQEPTTRQCTFRKASTPTRRTAVSREAGNADSMALAQAHSSRTSTAAYKSMLATRQTLPAWTLRQDIVDSVRTNPVTIISGETGSGKSTQSVQFILDDLITRNMGSSANIICTQPRRISAMGLAERVADERCRKLGEEIGYAIKGESKMRHGVTKICFVTTGVLLRRLQTSGGKQKDIVDSLSDVSHVVVDEVHERSLDTDFLLILLRDVLKQRKGLRVVLMSATLDAQVFEAYFKDVGSVGRVEIQGRTHPVTDYYLDDVRHVLGLSGPNEAFIETNTGNWDDEPTALSAASTTRFDIGQKPKGKDWAIDYDTVTDAVEYIDTTLGSKSGGILIFLPGTAEIDRTIRALSYHNGLYPLPLHASLLPADQRRVFPAAPSGKRKVVCATNVAETSITIPDIVAVIDTGRVKETAYDPVANMVRLSETWASRAACKQRRGRAGRVQAGTCYKLYTRATEQNNMLERPDPEIRRVPLEQLVLSVKSMGIHDVASFLANTLTPPDASAVDGAVTLLRRIGALDGDELTALGRRLSAIPADLRCAKLMIYGAVFGCLEACVSMAAILTAKSPFINPPNVREESKAARTRFGIGNGDLVADLRAVEAWQALRDKGVSSRDLGAWCAENYLSAQTLRDISSNRSQYLSNLKESGFVPLSYRSSGPSLQPVLNTHNADNALLRALIAASFTPQIARIEFPETKFAPSISGAVALDPEARTIKYFTEGTDGNQRVFLHPSSTLFSAPSYPEGTTFLSFFSKMATSKVFIRDATPLNAFALLMFGGSIEVDAQGRGLLVDGWVRLRGWARIGVLVGRLREMLDEELGRRWEGGDLNGSGKESEVVAVVRKLVELGGMDR